MNTSKARANRIWLTALVHCDAFRLSPLGYVQACLWRARGLKVRARNRLAALLGRSPLAYRLWMARVEPDLVADLLVTERAGAVEVIAVVDGIGSEGSVAKTLESLSCQPGARALGVVGQQHVAGAVTFPNPSDLAKIISESGSWLCIVPAGDLLAPHALGIYDRSAAKSKDAWVVYADDDLVAEGKRCSPHFKSSWNPELFEHHDFVTGSCTIRVTREMLAGLDQQHWAKQVTRRAIDKGSTPIHLAAVLHHRDQRPRPIVPAKPTAALPKPTPSMTIIIPTRNQASYLRKIVQGIQRTVYPDVDLIVVDNESDEPETLDYLAKLAGEGASVLPIPGAFNFSALNNIAVRHARSDMLCFLNNDVEVVDPDWLALLARQAMRNTIGAVGCRLIYPDGTLQHAGVVIGVGGGAAHAHRHLTGSDAGYFMRDRLPQRVSAVTAACLVVCKDKFLAVGGFNEIDFPVAFNDVDLCLKLNARGWQSFYEPRAVLIHHESKSRGSDSSKENRDRFAAELAALKRHWGTDQERDPYHHPQLSLFCEQFHIAI